MLKTTHAPTSDPLWRIRSFADSMAEDLLGPEDIGVLYQAIAYAQAEIRPLLSLRDHLLEAGWQCPEKGAEQAGGGS